jgi:hypothetical protein
MECHNIELDGLDTLHRIFRGYRSHNGLGFLFRGQASAEWELLPKAGRPGYYLPKNRDLGRFYDWTNKAVAYTSLPVHFLDQLALAQHHGLATRLLDWSLNPLVACFFACAEQLDKDGAVWIFEQVDTLLRHDILRENVESFDAVHGFLPRANFPRILNQKGVFTVHCDAARAIEVRPSRLHPEQPNLVCIRIPANLKLEIIKLLEDYGIDRSFLFPGLDGLSDAVNSATLRIKKAS